MYFGSVRLGKAYVAFHLMPLYMNEELTATISPALKKRMQGKTCFNFKTMPDAVLLAELKTLTAAGYKNFREKKCDLKRGLGLEDSFDGFFAGRADGAEVAHLAAFAGL